MNVRWIGVLALVVMGCTKPMPTLKGVDLDQWKKDRNACGGIRTAMLEAIRNEKNKLEGLTEAQIRELLGRPDQNELYKRNQKFYYYFLEPSSACSSPSAKPVKLVVRFNATERAKEIEVE